MFALGIMPYITASIIIQLLVVVIPRFEQLKKEGQSGQQKLTQYSRYLTIGLAILQSTGFIALARSGQLFPGSRAPARRSCTTRTSSRWPRWSSCMTAGTAVIMWLGELITDRGVGNGMSVLMFTSIAARIPNEGQTILQNAGGFVFTLICCWAWRSSWRSSSSSRRSAASRCSTPNGWSGGASTAARRPTCR